MKSVKKEEVLSKIADSGVVKVHVRQSLSNTDSLRKRTA